LGASCPAARAFGCPADTEGPAAGQSFSSAVNHTGGTGIVHSSASRKESALLARWTLALGVACLPGLAAAQEWPQFRGPAGTGVSTEARLPMEWSAGRGSERLPVFIFL
jgi:hypothetical protein